MQFAYVSFVNYNYDYINLMQTTILSVLHFSQYPLIVYCINFPSHVTSFPKNERLILRFIEETSISNIYYFKPFVIDEALKQGILSGYYIESDDVLTPLADEYLVSNLSLISYIPLSPIHPDDVIVPEEDMIVGSCRKKSQHYTHGHVLFTQDCFPFILQWLKICLSTSHSFLNADETVLNMMYWKYNCINHYLPIIDPMYENFYDLDYHRRNFNICTFHGCKNPLEQYKLFLHMKELFSSPLQLFETLFLS